DVPERRGVVDGAAECDPVLEGRLELLEQDVAATVDSDQVGVGDADDVDVARPQLLEEGGNVAAVHGLPSVDGGAYRSEPNDEWHSSGRDAGWEGPDRLARRPLSEYVCIQTLGDVRCAPSSSSTTTSRRWVRSAPASS